MCIMRHSQQVQHKSLQHSKMSSIWRQVVILIRIYWIWSEVSANGEIFQMNITLTWNESLKYCERIGKVLFDVKEDNYKILLMNRLNDGNQAWVAARVELSDFIKMPVCMATTCLQSNVSRTFDSDTISNCLKYCKDYRYIGLKERDCVCIKEMKNLTPSKACNTTCNNDQTHLCGGNQSFSLYEKVDTNITQKIAPGYKECVYAQNNDTTTELFTASCVGNTAEGGLCESDNTSECKNYNWTPIGSHLCRMDLVVRFRWKQVKVFCAGIGGQLVSPSELPLNLGNNRTYWLGIHRVTTIHEDEEETLIMNYTSCSVARKEGDIMMIEAENCQAKHTFLCQDKDIPEGVTHEKGSNSEHAGGTIIYLLVSVSVILLVAIFLAARASVFRRGHNCHRTEISADSSSSEHHVLQSTNTPAKPLRKTHSKKEHVQISYENIVHICSDQDVEMQQSGLFNSVPVDYDKIEFDKEHIQENDINEQALHIYDHTSLCKTEDQYDLTDLSGDTGLNQGETYHKIKLAQTLDTTNSVAREDCKVNIETYKQAGNDLYATMGQN